MIWIIGAEGMLGRELTGLFEENSLSYYGTDKETSILDSNTLKTAAEKIRPAWIVNCSGYTAVDKAEKETGIAYAINANGVGNIAQIASELDIPLIHISTDYVFNGTSPLPLKEDSPVSPLGVYGKSKYLGEEEVRKISKKHFIIRTAWLYGKYGPNFVYTMIKLMNSKETIQVVNDQHGSPTWTRALAILIQHIILTESNKYGTYHFSGEGDCSWFDFAEEIYRIGRQNGIIKSECSINPCSTEDFPTDAKRPEYSILSKEKVKKTFNIEIPHWKDSLSDFLSDKTISNYI